MIFFVIFIVNLIVIENANSRSMNGSITITITTTIMINCGGRGRSHWEFCELGESKSQILGQALFKGKQKRYLFCRSGRFLGLPRASRFLCPLPR